MNSKILMVVSYFPSAKNPVVHALFPTGDEARRIAANIAKLLTRDETRPTEQQKRSRRAIACPAHTREHQMPATVRHGELYQNAPWPITEWWSATTWYRSV